MFFIITVVRESEPDAMATKSRVNDLFWCGFAATGLLLPLLLVSNLNGTAFRERLNCGCPAPRRS